MNTKKIASKITLIVIAALLTACRGNLGAGAVETATATLIPPTETPTLTPSPTQTDTPTVTPIPTPIGGGNGILIFTPNKYQEQSPSLDGIYSVRTDGSDLHPILMRAELESLIGEYQFLTYLSNNGDGYLLTDTMLYSVTPDWKITNSIDFQNKQFISFSPDGKRILYTVSNTLIYVTNLDGSETKRIANVDVFELWWSADGEHIYYRPRLNVGYSVGIANTDGSGAGKLDLSSLIEYKPNEGTPLPEGIISVSYQPKFDSFSLSPDGNKVAFSYENLLFLADATDKEFGNPLMLAKFPNSADSIYWSPDGNYLLLDTSIMDWSTFSTRPGDSILIDVSNGQIKASFSPEKFGAFPCGFSPDGKYLAFLFIDWSTKTSGIRLVNLNDKSAIEVVNLDGSAGCPSWQK